MGKSEALTRVEPRVYPAGRAVTLFAIGPAEFAGRRLVVEGRRAQAVRFGRLALLVAYVDQVEYAAEQVERLRDRPSWLWNEARIHERVVERAAAHATVLPARLLTVFPHSAALEARAREQYARWSRALARTGSKRECVLHVYFGPHPPPGDAPYLVRVTARASRSARAPAIKGEPRLGEHVTALWRGCAAVATATRRVELAAARGAVLSAAFLTAEVGVQTLRDIVERSSEAGAALGVTAYLEGPRPAFTFV